MIMKEMPTKTKQTEIPVGLLTQAEDLAGPLDIPDYRLHFTHQEAGRDPIGAKLDGHW